MLYELRKDIKPMELSNLSLSEKYYYRHNSVGISNEKLEEYAKIKDTLDYVGTTYRPSTYADIYEEYYQSNNLIIKYIIEVGRKSDRSPHLRGVEVLRG